MMESSAPARARIAAAAILLDRLQHIKTYGARFRALGSNPMPDCLLGVLGHQGLELAFCPFVIKKCAPAVADRGVFISRRSTFALLECADRAQEVDLMKRGLVDVCEV
jgi:hypothetical protein